MRRPSEEYQTLPIEEDGDFPLQSLRSTNRSINTKHIILICLSIAVSIYLVIMFSQNTPNMQDFTKSAKSALSMACPKPNLDSTLTNDQRIDQLLYQSLKNAIMLGDEEQAQEATKQLIQSFKAQNLPQTYAKEPAVVQPSEQTAKQHDKKSANQPTKQSPVQPVEEPEETPTEEPTEEPAEKPAEEPAEKPAEKTAEPPVEQMKPGSTAAKGFNFNGVCGKDGYKCVISYGLYGKNPKYGEGAIENVKLLDSQFPGWVIRIYHDNSVPQELLGRLSDMGCELNLVDSAVEGGSIAGMFWRFLVAEDETVDRYIIRDSDSRLNPREKAAVDEWLASGYSIHSIRDHPNHDRPLNGGMWGGSKGSLLNIRKLIESSSREGYGADLTFLNEKVWPIVKYDQISHDSYSCHKYPNSHPFPTKRPEDYQHVGQVFEDNKPRMGDITGFLIGNPAPVQCRKNPDWLYG